MLAPEDRHLLTDALRPPPGHRVDAAVATTYTLDLFSVLLAPLAMAAYDHTEGDASALDVATPVALLESVRRHAEHTVVLCQAAGMHVPPSYPRLAAFAEGIVAEVKPPPGATFHPKIWLLRFVGPSGNQHHRFVCLSRNLTGDRSWDTVLVCDEDATAATALDAAPVATFVQELLTMTTRPLTHSRRVVVDDLCRTFSTARLGVPAPFTGAKPLPLGTPSGGAWPLPDVAESWLVVSPFLTSGAVGRLPRTTGRRVLLSRDDSLEQVGREACAGIETRVLQAMADAGDIDEVLDDDRAVPSRATVPARGLHAKIFCWDDGEQAHLVTGSANCTGAAFGGNIEMSVVLSGPRTVCGPEAVLGDDKKGLLPLTQTYEIAASEAATDEAYDAERRMEEWQAALADAKPVLEATSTGDAFDVSLRLTLPADPDGLAASTTARPLGLVNAQPLSIGQPCTWRGLALHALSPYLVIRTTTMVEGQELVRDCVILADVEGAPVDRLRRLLREMLADPAKVLAYLALLLGDLGAEDLAREALVEDHGAPAGQNGAFGRGFDDLVLLEPLLRAAARDDDALERAHRLLEDLRGDDGSPPPLDEDFLQLWQVVREATQS